MLISINSETFRVFSSPSQEWDRRRIRGERQKRCEGRASEGKAGVVKSFDAEPSNRGILEAIRGGIHETLIEDFHARNDN
jgi:hypothetical protein